MEVFESIMYSFIGFLNSTSLLLGLLALAIIMYLIINNTAQAGRGFKVNKEKRREAEAARRFCKWHKKQPTRQEAIHRSLFLKPDEKDLPKNLHKWEV